MLYHCTRNQDKKKNARKEDKTTREQTLLSREAGGVGEGEER
jgi:hypothetical protein